MKFIIVVFLIVQSFIGFGQLEQDYIPVQSAGEIPQEFRSLILEDIHTQYKERVDVGNTDFEKSVKTEFLVSSNWFLPSNDELRSAFYGLRTWGPDSAKPSAETDFWTSTQEYDVKALAMGYRLEDNFYSDGVFKDDSISVRALRIFEF